MERNRGEEFSDSESSNGGRREGETRMEYYRRIYQEMAPFVIISFTYLLFTVTDGGVRTIVLFQAFQKGFSSFETALMFVLYELAGVVTNFLAGIAGARWGLKSTLLVGLGMQVVGLGMLFGWSDTFTKAQAIVFVTIAQMLSGVAKDLVKLGGKAVTKLVTPDQKQERLFILVSWITGWKNSLKGVGYFLGGALVQWNYYAALAFLLALVLLAFPWAFRGLRSDLGRMRRENITWTSIFKKNHNINILSSARVFLFGSRDAWFDVPLPFYLRSVEGLNWERWAAAALLGGWIILYGNIQSNTPRWISKPLRQSPPNKYSAVLWAAISIINPIFLGSFMQFSSVFKQQERAGMVAVVIVGLIAFAIIFAINSSIHSYLVVKYSEGDKVAMNVGFYYMSNAFGRLMGTLIGGALFSFTGDTKSESLAACFWLSVGFIFITILISLFLDDDEGGLTCGPCLTCLTVDSEMEEEEEEHDELAGSLIHGDEFIGDPPDASDLPLIRDPGDQRDLNDPIHQSLMGGKSMTTELCHDQ
uniref:Major facilitator superfamily (MFS) profile domain-containing protein n=1 Tax=Compsopogon caeruleus TaxID=31354 RepID=A0A7S1XCB9_9RHOD|mmetsp:Transcript_16181/g.32797  ORF Transcript_16181/g.32797 Transcript_16181/m.32797 type:complete len:532 (+) Transcript_16181:200-1795(+)